MTAAERLNLISVDEYLAGELTSETKHEYVAGVVYAMAGASNTHNRIAGNFLVSIANQLRDKPCQPFNSDTKVRIQLPTHFRFYYPDGMIVCNENPGDDSFQDTPVVIAEVLSQSTRRTDEGEKRDAYLTIPSLKVYLLIDSEAALVVAWRRTEHGFEREVYTERSATIPLPEVDTELVLEELYERVDFSPESQTE